MAHRDGIAPLEFEKNPLLLLEREGMAYHPDLVILGFVYVDILRNTLSFNDYAKPRFELRTQGLVLANVPLPEPAQVLAGERWRSRLVDAHREAAVYYHETLKRAPEASDARTYLLQQRGAKRFETYVKDLRSKADIKINNLE